MKHLHLFYPENDLALAAGVANYTAPAAAVALRRAGSDLPLWYAGSPSDAFITAGFNAARYERLQNIFGKLPEAVQEVSGGYAPAPWGWSAASRRLMALYGVEESFLPSDKAIERIRMLSHRRTAAQIGRRLAACMPFPVNPAVEISDIATLEKFLAGTPQAVLKSPWSSSGRGVVFVNKDSHAAAIRNASGIIRRQGSVMAEAFYKRAADFAMLFEMDSDGICRHAGMSLFRTAPTGAYIGNVLASDTEIRASLGRYCDTAHLDAVAAALPAILTDIIGKDYSGPLGVDMLVSDNGDIVPCVEMNLRMTMGHVARRFTDRFMALGCKGLYTVTPATTAGADDDFSVFNGRLCGGSIELCRSGAFSFRVSLDG